MYWSIKQIKVEEKDKDDPSKFDKIIHAIKSNVSLPGFSNVLWTVRHWDLNELELVSGSKETAVEVEEINKMGSPPLNHKWPHPAKNV